MKKLEKVAIRTLGPNQIGEMRSLLNLFGRAFEDVERYTAKQPSDHYLSELLSKPHFIALIATSKEIIVGGLTGYVLEKFERETQELYIYDLAVDEPYRQRGIGTALIQELREIARQRDISTIFVQADLDDEAPLALYSKFVSKREIGYFEFTSANASEK